MENMIEKMLGTKKNSKKWIIPLVLGIIAFALGITLLILGFMIDDSNMGAGDWFENATRKGFFLTFGPFLTIVGIIVSTAVTKAVYSSCNYTSAVGSLKQQAIQNALQSINSKNGEAQGKEVRYCEYCECEMDLNAKTCPSCGARAKRTKK